MGLNVRAKRCKVVFFLLCLNHMAFAKTECDKSDWSCHSNFAFTLGYTFVHEFYTNKPLTEASPSFPGVGYSLKQTLPNNYNAIRLGFGSSISNSQSFGYEFYYTHIFPKSNTYNGFQYTGEGKSLLGFINYTFNPKSRTKYVLMAGAGVLSNYLIIKSVTPNVAFSATTSSMDLDPIVGGNISYQINSKFGVKVVLYYDVALYNHTTLGRVVPSLVLNYYPPFD